ncbi:MAG: single-stranded DNA-binding protein [Clostridia bacterium]|nr:single-stranded DNA-binding protein [Clostridia bacterium]MBQ9774265.1 single-stranded DNA-binding protein [Clostridia bacterium]
MSSLNLNKVVLCGRLTADPELKQTTSGIAVVSFTLAVNRRYQSKTADGVQAQQQADFISVVAWRQTAEFISRYFRKGSALCITGSIQTRSWQDSQGQKRYATEVVADEAMFVDSKNESGAVSGQYTDTYNAPSYSSSPASAPKFEELKTDDDLPF